MEQFTNPQLAFINRDRISKIESQKKQVRPDLLTPLKLGTRVPEHKFNHYEIQYGHDYWNKHPDPVIIRPPSKSGRPIPYLLNHTNEMLVDVAGTLYHNKDLKVMPYKAISRA